MHKITPKIRFLQVLEELPQPPPIARNAQQAVPNKKEKEKEKEVSPPSFQQNLAHASQPKEHIQINIDTEGSSSSANKPASASMLYYKDQSRMSYYRDEIHKIFQNIIGPLLPKRDDLDVVSVPCKFAPADLGAIHTWNSSWDYTGIIYNEEFYKEHEKIVYQYNNNEENYSFIHANYMDYPRWKDERNPVFSMRYGKKFDIAFVFSSGFGMPSDFFNEEKGDMPNVAHFLIDFLCVNVKEGGPVYCCFSTEKEKNIFYEALLGCLINSFSMNEEQAKKNINVAQREHPYTRSNQVAGRHDLEYFGKFIVYFNIPILKKTS
jgi:hypothetical protein